MHSLRILVHARSVSLTTLPQSTNDLGQTDAVDQLHRVEMRAVLTEFIERHDVGMAQLRCGANFILESLLPTWIQCGGSWKLLKCHLATK